MAAGPPSDTAPPKGCIEWLIGDTIKGGAAMYFSPGSKRTLHYWKRKSVVAVLAWIVLFCPGAVLSDTSINSEKNVVKVEWAIPKTDTDHYKIEINKTDSDAEATFPSTTYQYTRQNSYDLIIDEGFCYSVRVQAVDSHGVSSDYSDASVFMLENASKSTSSLQSAPTDFSITENYPNPFNSSTMISFSLPYETAVKLVIYNITGQKVAEPLNMRLASGFHTYSWHPDSLPSGTYFYSLVTDSYAQTKKMLYLK